MQIVFIEEQKIVISRKLSTVRSVFHLAKDAAVEFLKCNLLVVLLCCL